MTQVMGRGARTDIGIGLAIGVVAVVGATIGAAALTAGVPGRLAVIALVAGAVAAWVDDARAAVATAGVGFLLFDGFLVNRYGDLSWHGRTSLWQVAVLAVALGVGRGWRRLQTLRVSAARDRDIEGLLGATRVDHGETK